MENEYLISTYVTNKLINFDSFLNFMNFWRKISHAAIIPEFSIAPNGNLVAAWYKNSKRNLEIEFCIDNHCYYGISNGKDEDVNKITISDLATMLLSIKEQPLFWK